MENVCDILHYNGECLRHSPSFSKEEHRTKEKKKNTEKEKKEERDGYFSRSEINLFLELAPPQRLISKELISKKLIDVITISWSSSAGGGMTWY